MLYKGLIFVRFFCCRLLDSMKMPGQARSSGFHICDILDLNDAKVHGDPSGTISASTPISGKKILATISGRYTWHLEGTLVYYRFFPLFWHLFKLGLL